jgi:excisionase family DNA binding protein
MKLNNVQETIVRCRISRTKFYEEVAAGRLGSVKVGRRRLIPDSAIDAWISDRMAEALESGDLRPEHLGTADAA